MFERAETFGKKILQVCCLGSTSGVYGFSHAYSRAATTQLNLIEPYFDDVMLPICDNFHVEMFVYFFNVLQLHKFTIQISLLSPLVFFLSFCAKKPNLFQFRYWHVLRFEAFKKQKQQLTKMQSKAKKKGKKLEQHVFHSFSLFIKS